MFLVTTKPIDHEKPWANGRSQTDSELGSWWIRDSLLGTAWGITNRHGKFVIGGHALRESTALERAQSMYARIHGFARSPDGAPIIGRSDES